MGKARGPKRKEAPARKRLQASNPSNSALLQKQSRRNRGQGVQRANGLDGESREVWGSLPYCSLYAIYYFCIRAAGVLFHHFLQAR